MTASVEVVVGQRDPSASLASLSVCEDVKTADFLVSKVDVEDLWAVDAAEDERSQCLVWVQMRM